MDIKLLSTLRNIWYLRKFQNNIAQKLLFFNTEKVSKNLQITYLVNNIETLFKLNPLCVIPLDKQI